MQPDQSLGLDQIVLSDVAGFWTLPIEVREGAFKTLREQRPLAWCDEVTLPNWTVPPGEGFWAVTKHADVLEASRQPEIFCSGRGATSIVDAPQEMNDFFGSMINMDNPRHARLRRIVGAGFSARLVQRTELSLGQSATEIVDRLIDLGECDFVTEVAAKLPLKVICEMMGIPPSHHDRIFHLSNVIISMGDPEYVPEGSDLMTAFLTAGAELSQLVQDLGTYRREHPTDDLISALVTASVDGEQLDPGELGSFFILLVVAGNETTRNAMSHALHVLTQHPDQRVGWADDFERLAPTAVEEIVRWASPVIWMRRRATCDTTLGGHPIKENDKLLLFYNSANRDEDVFADPYTFSIGRTPNEHVGFGAPGPHFCLGAHLARREITVMWRELLHRVPDLAATAEPDRLRSSFVNGIKHLPCSIKAA